LAAASFAKRKEDWLRGVAADPRIRKWAPLAVAFVLTSYLNNETEDAWPSVDRLARDLNTDERNIRRALEALAQSGWLNVRRGGGRKKTNRYRMNSGVQAAVSAAVKGGVQAPLSDAKGGSMGPLKGGRWDRKRGVDGPPEPSIEPSSNLREDPPRHTRGSPTGWGPVNQGPELLASQQIGRAVRPSWPLRSQSLAGMRRVPSRSSRHSANTISRKILRIRIGWGNGGCGVGEELGATNAGRVNNQSPTGSPLRSGVRVGGLVSSLA
jgi:hypothetical protein